MRRSLIVTVAAAVGMVLLAMLVPMTVLLRDYALEDRLATAALEVQATETVVSGAGDDKGEVNLYVAQINQDNPVQTTVLYPNARDIGPHPGEDARVDQARATGQARVDDIDGGGAEILVPVSLGGSSAAPEQTPVIRIVVPEPGFGSGPTLRALLVMAGLGLALLVGALLMADRLGRSFVDPIRRLAAWTQRLGDTSRPVPVTASGPREVRELNSTVNRLVERVDLLLERERQGVSDLSHRLRTPVTALRLRIDALSDPGDQARLGEELDQLELMVDHIVTEARRSEREGLVVATPGVSVLAERARFWAPLAEDQDRDLLIEADVPERLVRASKHDLDALLDVLLDNVFTHTPEGTALSVTVAPREGGGLTLTVEDAGSGFPDGVDVVRRGTSGAQSSGLGLAIAHTTATESGGGLVVERSPGGGGRVVVELGPAG
jgi:signal transduction histidine kinase